ncbi:MAG TPA: hypothetical protein DCK95_06060 [Anaerolineaceae bacterium]|nr:hypothetical protein [Anaerolineaceae bacterium]
MMLKRSLPQTDEKDEQNSHPHENEPICGFFAGARCPKCKQGILDYNGMLNLQCPICGFENGYGFT